MCHGNVMNSAICHAMSPMLSSSTQRRVLSSSAPRSVTGEEAEPQIHFQSILAQRQSHKSIIRASLPNTNIKTAKPKHVLQLFLLRVFFSLSLLQFHVHGSATMTSPQLQRTTLIVCAPTQANASVAQGNWHPARGLCNWGGKKTTKGLKKKTQKPNSP